jgi:hypothetical protein
MILALKLLLTPLLIGAVTLAGRRWGPAISGLLIGLPLMSGPISLFLALEYGPYFAAQAGVGSLVGQGSFCLFCLTYGLMAQKWNWLVSTLTGIVAFVGVTAVWNSLSWSLLSACATLLGVIALGSRYVPYGQPSDPVPLRPPSWDLPARMVIAPLFVLVLTTSASFLGPQLSGLITPFPTTGLVVTIFTHRQQGAAALNKLLRANILGSVGFAGFFLAVGLCMPRFALASTYAVATAAAIGLGGVALYVSRKARS